MEVLGTIKLGVVCPDLRGSMLLLLLFDFLIVVVHLLDAGALPEVLEDPSGLHLVAAVARVEAVHHAEVHHVARLVLHSLK